MEIQEVVKATFSGVLEKVLLRYACDELPLPNPQTKVSSARADVRLKTVGNPLLLQRCVYIDLNGKEYFLGTFITLILNAQNKILTSEQVTSRQARDKLESLVNRENFDIRKSLFVIAGKEFLEAPILEYLIQQSS